MGPLGCLHLPMVVGFLRLVRSVDLLEHHQALLLGIQ